MSQVGDGALSHRRLTQSTEIWSQRASETAATPGGDEQLGRDITGWNAFVDIRASALSLRGMPLVVND